MDRSGLIRVRGIRRLTVAVLAIAVAALVAACGGTTHHRAAAVRITPATLLSQTAGSTAAIDSGHIDLALDVTLDGIKQLGARPLMLDVSGPFARSAGHGFETDLSIALSAAQANVTAGLDYVAGQLYVGLGGQFYKLGRASHASLGATGETGATGQAGATGETGMGGALGSLGIDPSTWLSSPHILRTADIGGVTTEHLHALIDVPNVLNDLAKLLSGLGGASGASGATSPVISALPLIESAITSATVDIYTGVADHIVRRVALVIDFTVPAIAAGVLGGLSGGAIDFQATLTGVNEPQSITAPANAQPESSLLNGVLALESQFGSLAPFVKQLGTMADLGGGHGGLAGLLRSAPASSGQG